MTNICLNIFCYFLNNRFIFIFYFFAFEICSPRRPSDAPHAKTGFLAAREYGTRLCKLGILPSLVCFRLSFVISKNSRSIVIFKDFPKRLGRATSATSSFISINSFIIRSLVPMPSSSAPALLSHSQWDMPGSSVQSLFPPPRRCNLHQKTVPPPAASFVPIPDSLILKD